MISAEAAKPIAINTCNRIGKYSLTMNFAQGSDEGRLRRYRSRRGLERGELLRHAFVLLPVLLHHPTSHQVLKLFVSTKPKHFFPSAGRISGAQILVNALEQV